jgi:hypothetical protein
MENHVQENIKADITQSAKAFQYLLQTIKIKFYVKSYKKTIISINNNDIKSYMLKNNT